jgi:Fe-S-cluster containining protein
VNELDKPLNTPCVHLCAIGCGIYEKRPQSCRDYDCAWLHGHFGIEDRPDKTGIVWSFEQIEGFAGLLVHAMIMNENVTIERIRQMFAQLQRTSAHQMMLQIIPHDLRAGPRARIHGKPVGPGVYVAVEATDADG